MFCLCGAVPLVPFVLGMDAAALVASVMTGAVFFAIGSAKSIWSTYSRWWSGLETLIIGLAAAGLAYGIGSLLEGLIA